MKHRAANRSECESVTTAGRRYGGCWITLAGLLLATTATAATPDLSGMWERYPPLSYPAPNGEEVFAIVDGPPLPSGEPQLREPYASAYKDSQEKKRAASERGTPMVNSSTQCLPQGVPTIMIAILPIEILQTRKQLVMLAEFLTQTRRIYLNEKMPPLDEISPSYNGHSVGRWEGNTLVVETRGVREDVQFLDFPHSADMKVTERLRLTAPDMLDVQISLEDAAVLEKPYVFTFKFKKRPDYRIAEFICDNNRYSLDGEGGVILDLKPGE